jgi:hypothetical protein
VRTSSPPRPGPQRLAPLFPILLGIAVALTIGYLFRTTIWDFMQHESDAAYFFETASTGDYDFSFDETLLYTENQLPLILYGKVYELMATLGMQANPIGGILVNALLVLATLWLALHYARTRFGFEPKRQMQLAALLSFNGLIMMYAGIHMRDAFPLLAATASVVAFHPSPQRISLPRHVARFGMLVVLAVVSFLSRTEGIAVPVLIYLSSIAVMLDYRRTSIRIVMVVLLLLAITLVIQFDLISVVVEQYQAYKLLSQAESGNSSLGHFLLYELPEPISTLAGNVLLLFVKIPFWRGALYDSYTFFMTLSALQMLIIAPAFLGVVWFALTRRLESRFRYLILILIAMLLITNLTSKQVRHFSILYPMLMIIYLSRREIVPQPSQRMYRYICLSMTGLVLLLSVGLELR